MTCEGTEVSLAENGEKEGGGQTRELDAKLVDGLHRPPRQYTDGRGQVDVRVDKRILLE